MLAIIFSPTVFYQVIYISQVITFQFLKNLRENLMIGSSSSCDEIFLIVSLKICNNEIKSLFLYTKYTDIIQRRNFKLSEFFSDMRNVIF